MLVLENRGLEVFRATQVRAPDHHAGKGHEEAMVAVYVVLSFNVVHDVAEVICGGIFHQPDEPAKHED